MGNGPAHIAQQFAGLKGFTSEIITVEERPFELGTTMGVVRTTSEKVRSAAFRGRLPILFAGGCINSLGPLSAFDSDVGLFWFDAHADFNTPETTRSGFIDGMALAAITGRCWQTLTASISGFRPIPEKSVVLIGARDLDSEERSALENSGITRLSTESIRKGGPEGALGKVLTGLPQSAYLHIDLDVLDCEAARVNEYSSTGGLTVSELLETIRFIRHHRAIVGAAITAYDPSVDQHSKALDAAVAIVKELTPACIDVS
jgi:arginase